MRAENGNLNMSQRYYLVDVDYLGEGDYERCENCGNMINNVAIVADEDGNVYRIGMDCMETIVNMIPSEKQEARNRANRLKRFIKFLKKECKSVVVDGEMCFFYKTVKDSWSVGYTYRCSKSLLDEVRKKVSLNEIKIVYQQ